MTIRSLRSFLFVSSSLLVGLVAQDAKPAAPTAATPAAAVELPHVRVIGASVSGGFRDGPMTGATESGESVTMQHLLKAWCGDHATASTHPPLEMMAMFTNPERIGQKQVQAALKAKPSAVVAIDFPFWFAYGHVKGENEASARAERFQKGLSLLAQFEVPVLVGDLPDMQGAARRMLAPAQIPAPDLLQAANKALVQFVAEHPQVRIVPLAATVATMKGSGVVLPLAGGPLQTPPGALLQGDKLHANRLGMAFLGHTLQPALQGLFPADHPLRKQTWTFEQFVAACGAEDDLAALQAAAKAKDGAKVPAGAGASGK